MNKVVPGLLILVGMINIIPVFGLFSDEAINRAYGLAINDPNLVVLLRHRALLFGLIGGFVLYSIFVPQVQAAALVMSAISMVGYLVLFLLISDTNQQLFTVARFDLFGIVLLIVAVVLRSRLHLRD